MELHHSKHHQTYVNSYNEATEKMAAADGPAAKIALQPLINFHGGGHINHSLFWENLAPKKSGGGEPPSGALAKAIEQSYGSLDGMKTKFNAALAGIQGSGWAWLVQDTQTGSISIKTYAVSTSIQKRLSTTAMKAIVI
jgi:superoxide dismutase, Fe-Mn family